MGTEVVVGGYSMFKVGDSAVYPAHGLAVIKRIEEKDVGGKKKEILRSPSCR